MIFAREAGAALVLVTLTLSLQCTVIAALISCVRASLSPAVHRLGPIGSAMLTAFHFSGASYATVGHGNVVLPRMWRTLGPVESIIGVLMCGRSLGRRLSWSQDSPVDLAAVEPELLNSGTWP